MFENMFEIITDVVFILLALVTLVWSVFVVRKLVELNRRFSAAIVLIPLYKRSKWPVFALSFLGVCLLADIIVMAVAGHYALCVSIIVIIACLGVILVMMISAKCAVLDSGALVPYRFIDWAHFCDYEIDGATIFFCGDKNGFDAVNAATTKLNFDEANKEKLTYILDKYKHSV